MNPTIILGAILAAPVLLLMVLRVNAAQVFLSLCLGAVLVQFVSSDVTALLTSTSAHTKGMPASLSFVNLALLLAPVILTTVIMIKSVKGHARLAFNLLPSIGVATLTALLAVPLLSANLTESIVVLPLWHQLQNLQTMIIGATTLLTLLFMWMQRPKPAPVEK